MQIKAIWKQNVKYQHLEGMRLDRGALNLTKVSSFIVPGVSSEQSAQDSGIPFILDGDYRWIFSVVGSFYSWKHKPLTFCSLLGVATISELGEETWPAPSREGEAVRGGTKGELKGLAGGLRLCKSPLPPQEPGKPWPTKAPTATCPKVSFAEHGLPLLCCAGPGQWPLCKDRSQRKGKPPTFYKVCVGSGFSGSLGFFYSSNAKALQGRS